MRTMFHTVLAAAAVALAAAGPAYANNNCDVRSLLAEAAAQNLRYGMDFDTWVNVSRVDAPGTAPTTKTVSREGVVANLRYIRERTPLLLIAENDFQLKPSWPLNHRYNFTAGQSVYLQSIRENAAGERFYVAQTPGTGRLMFVRMDGTICNKLANVDPILSTFLNGTYEALPNGRFRPDGGRESKPMTLKVVYLGAQAGTAKYREFWSVGGRLVHDETVEFDADAPEIEIGGLTFTQSNVTNNATRITVPVVPAKIEATQRLRNALRIPVEGAK